MANKLGSRWKHHKYVEKPCGVCGVITRHRRFCSNDCRSIGMQGIDCSGYHQGMGGKKHSAEALIKMSVSSKLAGKRGAFRWSSEVNPSYPGYSGMLGKHHSEETKMKLSLSRKKNNPGGFKKGYTPALKGFTKETSPRVAAMALKKKEYYLNGGVPGIGYPGFFASDLGHWVRSLWEANVARWLRLLGLAYEYEKYRFKLSTGEAYLPDFYIPSADCFIEVKGNYLGRGNLEKTQLFASEYNNKKVFVIDREVYWSLDELYSDRTPNWGKRR